MERQALLVYVCLLNCPLFVSTFRTTDADSSRIRRLLPPPATLGSLACASGWSRSGVPWKLPAVREMGPQLQLTCRSEIQWLHRENPPRRASIERSAGREHKHMTN